MTGGGEGVTLIYAAWRFLVRVMGDGRDEEGYVSSDPSRRESMLMEGSKGEGVYVVRHSRQGKI